MTSATHQATHALQRLRDSITGCKKAMDALDAALVSATHEADKPLPAYPRPQKAQRKDQK